MPKSPACTGAPAYGTPMQVKFTYPTMRETSGLTDALPTSEPASAQIAYTIGNDDLPTLTTPIPHWISPTIFAQGQNTSGAARTLSYRLEVNGTSVATGSSSISTSVYWGLSAFNWWNAGALPVSGDVLTVKLWVDGSGCSLNAHALKVTPTRPLIGTKKPILWYGYGGTNACTLEASAPQPSWMTATPTTWTAYYTVVGGTGLANSYIMCSNAGNKPPYIYYPNATYGLFYTQYGDQQGTGQVLIRVAATAAALQFCTETRVTLLTYLPLNIKI